MTVLTWDDPGKRIIETGTSNGVLYRVNGGVYDTGVAWNGLTAVNEQPSGAEPTKLYADNIPYITLMSTENYKFTIECYTYPDAFLECDGGSSPVPGLSVGQQPRKPFGFSWVTLIANDTQGSDYGYKIHVAYGGLASPSEKGFETVNDTPDGVKFSYEVDCTPVPVAYGTIKPVASLTIDSTKVPAANMTAIKNALWGTASTNPRLPLPDELITMASGTIMTVTPSTPTFTAAGGTIVIPSQTGVVYRRVDTNAIVPAGNVVIATAGATLGIRAYPANGTYQFAPMADDYWAFTRTT